MKQTEKTKEEKDARKQVFKALKEFDYLIETTEGYEDNECVVDEVFLIELTDNIKFGGTITAKGSVETTHETRYTPSEETIEWGEPTLSECYFILKGHGFEVDFDLEAETEAEHKILRKFARKFELKTS